MHGWVEICHACRSRAHQRGIFAQQLPERRDVTVDDCLDSAFEPRHRRARFRDGLDVLVQAMPVGEVVPARKRE